MYDWIARLFRHPELAAMGHHQRVGDLNLGLGWIYYALARALRPATAVVIGSYRGFVPLVIAKALADNGEGGTVALIEPSLVDDFWKDPAAVRRWFAEFGVGNIEHYAMTTQQFAASGAFGVLSGVGLLFIDGYHSFEQARFDYESFRGKLAGEAWVLFHDSVRVRASGIYGKDRVYEHRVKDFVDLLKRDPALQIVDLPLGDGVTLVRRAAAA